MKYIQNNSKNKLLLLPTLLCSASLLVACGGAESTDSGNDTEQDTSLPQAVALTETSNSDVNVQARAEDSQLTITDDGSDNLQISMNYSGNVSDATKHTQIFLNTDNDVTTGFRFDGVAWGAIGADYMIQNAYIYKSQYDSTQWAWTSVGRVTDYQNLNGLVTMSVDRNLIGEPCDTVQAGHIGRNSTWGIETMYPVATELLEIPLAACSQDQSPPSVKIIGSSKHYVTLNGAFDDPGATAIDNVDGDMSAQIVVHGSVDTSVAGNYQLTYVATDSSGKYGYAIRTVVVLPEGEAISGVGLFDGWGSNLTNLQIIPTGLDEPQDEGHTIQAFQDWQTHNLYLAYMWEYGPEVPNFQIYLDTDNNPETGFKAWASESTSAETGAEYLIENGVLLKYTGSNNEWKWSPEEDELPYFLARCADPGNFSGAPASCVDGRVIIPSSIINNGKVGIMAMRINDDWTIHNIWHKNSVYTPMPADVTETQSKSVVEYCGNTYETDGTLENTSITSLTAPPSSNQPTALGASDFEDGQGEIGGRRYYVEGSVEVGRSLLMEVDGVTSSVDESAIGQAFMIVGAHADTLFYVKGNIMFAHNGSVTKRLGHLFNDLGYFTNAEQGDLGNSIVKIDGLSDDFFFSVTHTTRGSSFGTSYTTYWRISGGFEGTPVKIVDKRYSAGSGISLTSTTDYSNFYSFEERDYVVVRSTNFTSPNVTSSTGLYQYENGIRTGSAGSPLDQYIENAGRLFIVIEPSRHLEYLNSFDIPGRLYAIDGESGELVTIATCDIGLNG